MGLIDALRKAEKESRGVAHRGFDIARSGWEDAERRLRRKMRIFPGRTHKLAPVAEAPADIAPDRAVDAEEIPPIPAGKNRAA